MALSEATISLDLHQILGDDFDSRRTKIRVYTNVANQTLMDTSTGETRLGDQTVTIGDDGTASFTTWTPGADGNPTSWQTYIAVDYPRTGARDRVTRTFGPYTIEAANDGDNLTDLEEEQALPPAYLTTVTEALDAIVAEGQEILDQQELISGLTGEDEAVALLIDTPSSETATSLAASTAAVAPRVFGVADATGTDWTKINVQIAAASANGGGRVVLQPGAEYVVAAPLVLLSKVVLDLNGSTIRLADGANCDVIQSVDFDDLTGNNLWLVSEGVPIGFGVVNGYIDGNADNNTSGAGIRFFGKRYILDNLIICNTADEGWYTECGAKGGQEDTDDLPENNVGQVWIRNTGGKGAIIRGPHDQRIESLLVAITGDIGVHVEKSATYEGACDIGFMHVYASQTEAGIVADTEVHVDHMISESHFAEGLITNVACRISQLSVFNNQIAYMDTVEDGYAPQANAHVILNGQDTEIGIGKITAYYGGTGCRITASAKVGHLVIGGGGGGNTGLGLDMDASNVQGQFEVRGFDGAGGIGVRLQETTGVGGCSVDASVSDCATLLTSPHVGDNNRWTFRLIGDGSGTQVGHALTEATKQALRTVWSIGVSGSATGSSFYRNNLAQAPQVDIFTTVGNATYTKPDGALWVEVIGVGAGGGGASGALKAAATASGGGGGGAGGITGRIKIAASDIGATENVTIGAGGTAGAAASVNDASGNNGGLGGTTYFGTSANRWLNLPGGSGGVGGTTGGGSGGNAAAPGGSTGAAGAANGAGASGNAFTSTGTSGTAPGGGGGGGVSAAEAASAGGIGGVGPSGNASSTPAGGVAPGGAGNAGNAARGYTPGGSGSGGAGGVAVPGGAGGNGANPGGGGGGGGGSRNGQTSGAGGNGGNGQIVVITHFA